jgi:hypothetical protein
MASAIAFAMFRATSSVLVAGSSVARVTGRDCAVTIVHARPRRRAPLRIATNLTARRQT